MADCAVQSIKKTLLKILADTQKLLDCLHAISPSFVP